jgi:hypothetical protein
VGASGGGGASASASGPASSSSATGGAGGAGGCAGTCVGSTCTPQVLYSESAVGPYTRNLILFGDYIYWANSSAPETIKRVRKSGGSAEQLVKSANAWNIALDSESLYWSEILHGRIMKAPIDGSGTPTVLVPGSSSDFAGLAVSGPFAYWAPSHKGGIWRVPTAGGDTVKLANSPDPRDLTANAISLFWTSQSVAVATLVSMPLGGGPITPLATQAPTNFVCAPGVALGVDAAYWTRLDLGSVERVPFTGGLPMTLALDVGDVCSIAVDNDNAYFTNIGVTNGSGPDESGWLAKVPIAGGPMTTLVSSPTWAMSGVAVDDECVYFSVDVAGQTGQILRVAKSSP